MEPVTRAENVRRQAEAVTICAQGHIYDDDNTYLWRGRRACRTCRAARNVAKNEKKKIARAQARTIATNIVLK